MLPHSKRRLPHGEVVIAREDQVERLPVGAHPLGREAARFARAHVPLFREVHRRPRAPRLWRVVAAEAAVEARIGAGQDLAADLPKARQDSSASLLIHGV